MRETFRSISKSKTILKSPDSTGMDTTKFRRGRIESEDSPSFMRESGFNFYRNIEHQ